MINLHSPFLEKEDKKHAIRSINSQWISTSGSYIQKFESKFNNITGLNNSVAVSTGTNALQLALKISGANNSNEVLLPSLSFIATANAILYNNSNPVFVDIEKDFNIDVEKIIDFLKFKTKKKKNFLLNKKTNRRIIAVVVVHVFGNPVKNLNKLVNICKKNNIKIIEDAAEAVGSYFFNKNKKKTHIGCEGDFSCFSFNANKTVTAGAGGMICCRSKKDFDKAKYLSSTAKNYSFNFTHNECGHNYRITNLHASIGYSQLNRLSDILKKKRTIAKNYYELFKNSKSIEFIKPDINNVNCWFNIIRIKSKINLDKNFEIFMNTKKIETRALWKPLHTQKYLKIFEKYKIKNTIKIIKNCYCIPSGPNLKKNDILYVFKAIDQFSKKYIS